MDVGIIKIELSGLGLKETERVRDIVHRLITEGGVSVKEGKTILNWTNWNLMSIKTEIENWKRKKI